MKPLKKPSQAAETRLLHGEDWPDPENGALSSPIQMSTAFRLPGFGSKLLEAVNLASNRAPHLYSRWTNPTLRTLEKRLAELEGAEAGLVFSSGMAAVSALLLTVLSSGDHLVAAEVCYAGALELMALTLPRFGIEVTLVDTSQPEQIRAALRPNTKLVYVETPANPILRLTDIQAVAEIAHAGGVPLAVDSTFAGLLLQHPLALGADYVVHSLTKYANGHVDALGGVVLGRDADILKIRKEMLVHLGGALSPHHAWLILRGLETLALRLQKHCTSALRIASFLEAHPAVERVFYPGLASHPQQALAARQMQDYGGMLSFQLKGGLGAAISLAEKIRLVTYATSLGHPQSLMFYYPADIFLDAAPYYTAAQRENLRPWVGRGLVRLSVGLEDPDDLMADLDQALRGRTIKGVLGPWVYQMMK